MYWWPLYVGAVVIGTLAFLIRRFDRENNPVINLWYLKQNEAIRKRLPKLDDRKFW